MTDRLSVPHVARGTVRRLFSRLRTPVATLLFCGLALFASQAWAPPAWLIDTVSSSSETWVSCTPSEVLEWDARVHVRCTSSFTVGSASGISYFAVPTYDTVYAARFTTVVSSAMVGGLRVRIKASSTDDGSPFGCARSNCRPPRAFGIVP